MKNGYRFTMTKGYRHAQVAFGNNFKVFKKAKAAWMKYRRAWRRQKYVTTAAWSGLLQEIEKYQNLSAAVSMKKRIKQRWDNVPYTSAKSAVSLNGRVHLVTVCRHRGLDLNVEKGIADVTLCHRKARMTAKVGDLMVGISAVPVAGEPKPDGRGSRWPPAFFCCTIVLQ